MTAFDCPRCGVTLTMSERNGIEIDYCPQCRGVWLDRGELDKIIERSLPAAAEQPPAQPPVQPPAQQGGSWVQPPPQPAAPPPWPAPGGGHHGGGHHGGGFSHGVSGGHHGGYSGRRRSWLSELFD